MASARSHSKHKTDPHTGFCFTGLVAPFPVGSGSEGFCGGFFKKVFA